MGSNMSDPSGPTRSALIGVDVGATSMSAGLVTLDGEVLDVVEMGTHVSGPRSAVATLLRVVQQLVADARRQGLALGGVGVGLPGPVDAVKGMMLAVHPKNHVPEFGHLPLAEQIRELTHLPTFVDNDVNALALAEHAFGAGRGTSSLALLAVGTEVGGALIIDGALVRGQDGYGGELGHVPINFDGPACICGGRGCLGAYLGGRLLAEEARRRVARDADSPLLELAGGHADAITSAMVFAAAAAGDAVAVKLVDQACEALAATLAVIVNGINPEMVVVTGGVAPSLAPLVADVVHRAGKYALGPPLANTRIRIAATEKRLTVRGGAALVLHELARRGRS
jgi:predicted NBD/HSP70 family sugar kinase